MSTQTTPKDLENLWLMLDSALRSATRKEPPKHIDELPLKPLAIAIKAECLPQPKALIWQSR